MRLQPMIQGALVLVAGLGCAADSITLDGAASAQSDGGASTDAAIDPSLDVRCIIDCGDGPIDCADGAFVYPCRPCGLSAEVTNRGSQAVYLSKVGVVLRADDGAVIPAEWAGLHDRRELLPTTMTRVVSGPMTVRVAGFETAHDSRSQVTVEYDDGGVAVAPINLRGGEVMAGGSLLVEPCDVAMHAVTSTVVHVHAVEHPIELSFLELTHPDGEASTSFRFAECGGSGRCYFRWLVCPNFDLPVPIHVEPAAGRVADVAVLRARSSVGDVLECSLAWEVN